MGVVDVETLSEDRALGRRVAHSRGNGSEGHGEAKETSTIVVQLLGQSEEPIKEAEELSLERYESEENEMENEGRRRLKKEDLLGDPAALGVGL